MFDNAVGKSPTKVSGARLDEGGKRDSYETNPHSREENREGHRRWEKTSGGPGTSENAITKILTVQIEAEGKGKV